MKKLLAGLIILCPAALFAQPMANLTKITPLVSTTHYVTGERIALPSEPELRAVTYELPVGGALPVHKHPFPRYAYVLQGELEVFYVETNSSKIFSAGSFIAEAPDHWHYGKNIGEEPLKMLVIDHVTPGAPPNTILKTPKG